MCHYFIVAGAKDFNQYVLDYENAYSNKEVLARMVSRSLKIKKSYHCHIRPIK